MGDAAWSTGQLAEVACILEASAAKAGNVHPGAGFADASWMDFVLAAVAAAPALGGAGTNGVGAAVLAAVRASRAATGSNINLGMILLLAPLCAVPAGVSLEEGVPRVLAGLTGVDAQAVFEAIALANPGGLGKAERADVREPARVTLLEAMRLAAERDAVARQYATDFFDVFKTIAPGLVRDYQGGMPLERAIVIAHLRQMAAEPDSLIRRKCGDAVAEESARRAGAVLEAGGSNTPRWRGLFEELDAWLRADGNRRNPGTSADLIAAALYVALREGGVARPWRWSV